MLLQCIFNRSVDAPLVIKVIDKNDNDPIFEETKIIVRLFQDVRIRTVVAKVKVIRIFLSHRNQQ